MRWKINDQKTILKTYPFDVEELHLEDQGTEATYHRLLAPDWVNILPICEDNRTAVLIRQDRAGSMSSVLETPGGILDPGEERDPMLAAVRELEEETGFTTRRVLPLGTFFPNPAIQNNRVHLFIGLGCTPKTDREHFPDSDERIVTELVPVAELEDLVRTGRIGHALCGLCILLGKKYYGSP